MGKIATKKNIEKVGKSANAMSNFILENNKPFLIIGGVLLGWYLVKQARKGLSDAFTEKSENVDFRLPINTQKATIDTTQAGQFAQQLLDACNEAYPFYGTDEETIQKIFERLQNGEDFKLVYKAFGMKNYNGYNSPPVGFFRHIDNYEPRDLVYWLKSELSPSDGEVYRIVKQRIESAGWRF